MGKGIGLVGQPRNGVAFGLGEIRARILRDGESGLALGGPNQGHGAFDLAGGQLLSAGGQKQGHLQGRGQATELEGGDRTKLSGLNEGPDILAQTPDEPQPPQHPGFPASQKPGDGRRLHAVGSGEVLHQSGFFPQGDRTTAGIEGEHQRFGLLEVGRKNPHGNLSSALGLENGQALEAVNEFQPAVESRDGQGLLDLPRATDRRVGGRIAFEIVQTCPDGFEVQVRKFHIVFARIGGGDF